MTKVSKSVKCIIARPPASWLAGWLAGGGKLFNAAESFAVAGMRKINLPARQSDRAARTATVEIRFGEVEICRPRDEQDRGLPKTVRLRLVEVREIGTPEGVEPLHWRLLTTHDGCGKSLGNCGLVPGALDHRTIVPGDKIARAATGGQPTRFRRSPLAFARACW
jgi:hypothetical protein